MPEDDVLIVLFAFFGLFAYTVYNVFRGNYALIILYAGNLLIVIYKHRKELSAVQLFKTKRKCQ